MLDKRGRFARPTLISEKYFNFSMSSRAQIWVETVIYTLIALAMVGLVLAFAKPKIESVRDRMLIEQTIDSMNKISEQITEVQLAPGNKRVLSVKINKGKIVVDPETNSISWVVDSVFKYSEIGRPVKLGSLSILTEGNGPYVISVTSNYSVDLTLDGKEDSFGYESSPNPYMVTVTSNNIGGVFNVDMSFK